MKTSKSVLCKTLGVILLGLGAITPLMSQEAVQKKTAVLFYGVYTQWYKFDKALDGYALKTANAHSERVQDFPSVKDLFNAKLVILSDVSGGEFTEAQVKQIKAYVEQG
ncbi:MAG: hypothetical protein KKE50_07415, partial [Nanoarchaeota archaeon]|nr:hypothetical protein [Nanoarchaeota archaeon]